MSADLPADPAPGQEPYPGAPFAGRDDLRALSASRLLAVDEHMFTAAIPSGFAVTCRLQLFTAAGARPVAVATQCPGEGVDLEPTAELLAGAVWERHCPDQELPPVWIRLRLMPGGKPGPMGFQHGQFAQIDRYRPRNPRFSKITHEQLRDLVGAEVDAGRGAGYVPRAYAPELRLVFEEFAVAALAPPRPFRAPACMPPAGVSWWRRRLRQALPRRGARSCCWYHGGDWHAVSTLALQVLRRARAQGVEPDDMEEFAIAHAAAAGVTGWQVEALATLFNTDDAIQPSSETGYVNGQHRTQAMIEAGVRRTVVLRTVDET